MPSKFPDIFLNPKIDYPIYDLQLHFSDYITQSEHIIAHTRQDLSQHPELTIKNNAPFELKPDATKPVSGVLLIHGLLDSSFIMRDIGDALQSQGLLVRSILLPGHGTVPGALLNTHFTEWQQAVHYGVATLKKEVEKVFLVGFSTGATLAISHALKDPSIAGVILIAPAFKINSPFTFLSSWMRDVKWQRGKWFSVCEEIDDVKYQSITFNAIYQVYQLGLAIQKKFITCPLFMILSQEDKIICSRAALQYFEETNHRLNRALLYSEKPRALTDPRILVRTSVYPDENIFSFCHISLPVSPNNSHYGKNGDYILSSHLLKNIKYGALDKMDAAFYTFLKKLHFTEYDYQRLTFNPDFEFMQHQIGDFVSDVLGAI